MRKRKIRRSAFRLNRHFIDVIAVETFERAYIESQPSSTYSDEHICAWHLMQGWLSILVDAKQSSGSGNGKFSIGQQQALSR
jgi:hypothetical protein